MMRDDVLAKIYLIDGKFAMNVDNNPDDCCNHVKTRKYFGPIDLRKIHVRLLNQYGRVINLNNMDYSFSLEVAQLYKKSRTMYASPPTSSCTFEYMGDGRHTHAICWSHGRRFSPRRCGASRCFCSLCRHQSCCSRRPKSRRPSR